MTDTRLRIRRTDQFFVIEAMTPLGFIFEWLSSFDKAYKLSMTTYCNNEFYVQYNGIDHEMIHSGDWAIAKLSI